MNEVAYVIQRHENHDGSANRVDGLHAPGRPNGRDAHASEHPAGSLGIQWYSGESIDRDWSENRYSVMTGPASPLEAENR